MAGPSSAAFRHSAVLTLTAAGCNGSPAYRQSEASDEYLAGGTYPPLTFLLLVDAVPERPAMAHSHFEADSCANRILHTDQSLPVHIS
jgi:hypothetical protein